MYLTPILWVEIAVALALVVLIVWTKPEYGLFLYGLALGFPDCAYPFGATVNIRVDDVLIVLFLARSLFWAPLPSSRSQKNILLWQAIFLVVCVFSIAVEIAQGTPPGGYEAAKMAGCAAIVFVLPRLLQSETRLRYFIAGLMGGGIALVIQVRQHLGESSSSDFANFQEFKSAATFSTWNPNTIGQAALLLVFAAGLGAILFSKTPASRILWPGLAMGFALVPASMFVRGTSLSIAAGFVLFFCLLRRWKWLLLFAAVFFCAILYLNSLDPPLMESAASVNLTTGEGLSHRFDRWDMALQAIQREPWAGQGFGQELNSLTLLGSEGRAHNTYLAVWLELGLGGLLLLLAAVFQFVRAGLVLFRDPRFETQGAAILSVILALCLDSLGFPTLYFEKLPTIALSLVVAVVGMRERDDVVISPAGVHTLAGEPVTQQT
jgi:O-antigen ligase